MIVTVTGALEAFNKGLRTPFDISDASTNIEANLAALSEIERSGNLSSLHIKTGTFNTNNYSFVIFNGFTPTFSSSLVIGYNFVASAGETGIYSDAIYLGAEEYLKSNEESLQNMMDQRFKNWLQVTQPDGTTKLKLFYENFLQYQNVLRHLTEINPNTGEKRSYQLAVLDVPAGAVASTLAWAPDEHLAGERPYYVEDITVRDSATNISTYLEVLQTASASKIGMITLDDVYIPEIDLTWERLIKNFGALTLIKGFLEIQTTDNFDPALVTNYGILATLNYLLHPSNAQGIVVKGYNSAGETLNGTDLFDYIVGSVGSDVINGFLGNDNLNGGVGKDSVYGGAGYDEISGQAGDDYLDGGEGINTLSFKDSVFGVEVNLNLGTTRGLSAESLYENGIDNIFNFQRVITGSGDDVIFGISQNSCYLETGIGSDFVVGGSQWDYIYTGYGDDEVLAGGGDDIIVGGAGAGNDSYNGGLGFDTVSYTSAKAAISINLFTGKAISRFGGDLAGIGIDTLVEIEKIIAGNYGDLIVGDGNFNELVGLDGNDSIFGGDGDDILVGGGNKDSLDGGAGNDLLTGGSGNDLLIGGLGTDMAFFSGSFSDYKFLYNPTTQEITITDRISGRDGIDTVRTVESLQFADGTRTIAGLIFNVINGTTGNDVLVGTSGSDMITGFAGNDTLFGAASADIMDGGEGSDIYVITNNADHVLGEVIYDTGTAGIDEIRFSTTSNQTLFLQSGLSGVEKIVIGTGTDSAANTSATTAASVNASAVLNALMMQGNDGANSMTGTAQSDNIQGGAGNDTLNGGAGNDALLGGAGNDTYVVENSADLITEDVGGGTDVVQATATSYTLASNLENLTFTGTTGNFTGTGNDAANSIVGGKGNDTLNGGAGNDTLAGGAGNDIMTGGTGADSFVLLGNDTVVDFNSSESDTITTTGLVAGAVVTFSTVTGSLNLSDSTSTAGFRATAATSGAAIVGGSGKDSFTGGVADDALSGGLGNDTLSGGNGADTITGGVGADSLTGGSGTDTFVFSSGNSGQVTGSDTITDYAKGSLSVGDLIDYSVNLTRGGSAVIATGSQASINQSTGIATFAAKSGTTLQDALNDLAARLTSETDAAGEMAFFKVANKGNFYLFISDGTAGVSSNDVLVQLTGVTSISSIDLTSGNLTITA